MPSISATGVVTLAGVALGILGTIATQYLTTRESRRAARSATKAALRSERKTAVLAFLEGCQRAEQAAEDRAFRHEQRADPDALKHNLWYQQKCITLVAGPHVRSAAFRYAERLTDAIFHDAPTGDGIFGFISEERDPFIEAVREELGIPEE